MIIDFHAHLYPPSFMVRREEIIIRQDETFALLFGNPKARIASAPELLLAMDKSNVDVTVTLGPRLDQLERGPGSQRIYPPRRSFQRRPPHPLLLRKPRLGPTRQYRR